MPNNGQTLSIILDRNQIILLTDINLKFVHGWIPLLVIGCIDEDFIVYFVQAGCEGDFFLDDLGIV